MGKCCFKSQEKQDLNTSLIESCGSDTVGMTVRDFQIIKVLGRGSIGRVFLVKKNDTGEYFAMKVIKKQKIALYKQTKHIKTQRLVLQQSKSPFIVDLKYAFQSNSKLYLVLQFMQGGELFFHMKKVQRLPQSHVKFYIAELVLAIQYLHSQDIIYRDLKPENILLDKKGHIKLADFGLSKQLQQESEESFTFCGTPEYLSPEIILREGYTKAVDFWGLGVLMFEMLTGAPPHYSKNKMHMYTNIVTKPIQIPSWVSPQAFDLLKQLICQNISERLQNFQILKNHPFFAEINWEKLWRKQVQAPIKPFKGQISEVANFDKTFTKEPAVDSVDTGIPLMDVNFSGFTYLNTGYLDDTE